MKKHLLLAAAALLSLTAHAEEQTASWNALTAGFSDMSRPSTVTLAEGYTATFGGPSANYSPLFSTYYGGLQFYAGSTLKIEGSSLKKIVLEYREGYAGNLTADGGTLNTNATNYTWTGSADAVTFTNSVQGLRLTDITITFDPSASPGEDGPGEGGTDYSDDFTTPATPSVNAYSNSLYGNTVTVTIPTEDINGVALNPANVYFKILKDIERVVSDIVIAEVGDVELYKPITEDLVVVPFSYEDYYVEATAADKRLIYLDNQTDASSYNKIGVQTIYKDETNELLSEIAWRDIKDYSTPVGIASARDASAASVALFDAQGRKATAAAKGLVIKQVTYTDGTSKTLKTFVR